MLYQHLLKQLLTKSGFLSLWNSHKLHLEFFSLHSAMRFLNLFPPGKYNCGVSLSPERTAWICISDSSLRSGEGCFHKQNDKTWERAVSLQAGVDGSGSEGSTYPSAQGYSTWWGMPAVKGQRLNQSFLCIFVPCSDSFLPKLNGRVWKVMRDPEPWLSDTDPPVLQVLGNQHLLAIRPMQSIGPRLAERSAETQMWNKKNCWVKRDVNGPVPGMNLAVKCILKSEYLSQSLIYPSTKRKKNSTISSIIAVGSLIRCSWGPSSPELPHREAHQWLYNQFWSAALWLPSFRSVFFASECTLHNTNGFDLCL